MSWFALPFAAGVLCFQQLPVLPGPSGLLMLLGVLWPAWRWLWIRPLFWCVLGFAWAQWYAVNSEPPAIPGAEAGPVRYLATGTLISLPQRFSDRARFAFRVRTLSDDGHLYRGDWKVRVTRSRPTVTASRSCIFMRMPGPTVSTN